MMETPYTPLQFAPLFTPPRSLSQGYGEPTYAIQVRYTASGSEPVTSAWPAAGRVLAAAGSASPTTTSAIVARTAGNRKRLNLFIRDPPIPVGSMQEEPIMVECLPFRHIQPIQLDSQLNV